MSQNKTINTISGKLILDKGDWRYITSAHFYSLDATINLTWQSLDPTIAQINYNSGLIYAKSTGETTVIGVSNDETITVLCSIKVQSKATEIVTTATGASVANITPRSVENCSDDISAMGYSGTVYEYTILGNRVTLEKGFGAKNGTSNIYSNLFRSALVEMDNIYASMSPTQRAAWMELRIRGLLDNVISWLTRSPEELAKNYIKDALINTVISMDEIEALIYGCSSWYRAEQRAISNFEAF